MRAPLNLEDLVAMRFERVELQAKIAEIPESDRLVSGSCSQNKLGVWVEGKAVDFGCVSVNRMPRCILANVPNEPKKNE